MVIFGCGRTPPEGFWEPTKDDTAGIVQAVEAKKNYFRTGLAELAMQYCDTAIAGTTGTIFANELRGNRFKARFLHDSMQHIFDSNPMYYTYIAGLDTLNQETTCTVTLTESIFGKLRMHAKAKTDSLRDSLVPVGEGETLRLPFYSDTMTPCNIYIEKPISGASVEGCVLKKVDGVWQLWKLAGGGRFYAPGPADAPAIGYAFVRSSRKDSVTIDTVLLRPDTTHFGIQRFYSVAAADSQLLTYSVGDWLRVSKSDVVTNQLIAFDYLYFNGRRYEFGDTVKFDAVPPGSIYRLSLEHVPGQVLWETKGDYNAVAWGIPIRIQ